MKIEAAVEATFAVPERPNTGNLEDLVRASCEWVNQNIRYSVHSKIYRPEKVIEKIKDEKDKGGNCFAQAIGGIMVLESWGVQSGVVYDGAHASYAATNGEDLLFGDPANGEVGTLNSIDRALHTYHEAGDQNRRSNNELGFMYNSYLIGELAGRDCVRLFRTEEDTEGFLQWQTAVPTTSGQSLVIDGNNNAHIIIDAARGVDMLLAIGDLTRYATRKDPRLAEVYDDLIQQVPVEGILTKPSQQQ